MLHLVKFFQSFQMLLGFVTLSTWMFWRMQAPPSFLTLWAALNSAPSCASAAPKCPVSPFPSTSSPRNAISFSPDICNMEAQQSSTVLSQNLELCTSKNLVRASKGLRVHWAAVVIESHFTVFWSQYFTASLMNNRKKSLYTIHVHWIAVTC